MMLAVALSLSLSLSSTMRDPLISLFRVTHPMHPPEVHACRYNYVCACAPTSERPFIGTRAVIKLSRPRLELSLIELMAIPVAHASYRDGKSRVNGGGERARVTAADATGVLSSSQLRLVKKTRDNRLV